MDEKALLARANELFPGATVVDTDTPGEAKKRLMLCIREGAPGLPQVERWALACEAACLARDSFREPYRTWADDLISDDLEQMRKLFLEHGVDPGDDSADPLWWFRRRPVSNEVRNLARHFLNEITTVQVSEEFSSE